MFAVLLRICAIGLILGGCSRAPAPREQTSAPPAPEPAPASRPADDETVRTLTGPVVETMDAGTYTYVRVKSGTDDVWAATSQFKVAVGERVTIPLEMAMDNFHSKALNRNFPLIYFASYIAREGEPVPAAPRAIAPMGSHGSSAATPPGDERIEPKPGVTAVDEVWATRASLKGKSVTVRGKVVKYNAGIMGVNWLHIQDGTGTAGDKTNDVAVTTSDVAKVGDVVTATGTVAVDKDFGAGYAYPVIIERARLH